MSILGKFHVYTEIIFREAGKKSVLNGLAIKEGGGVGKGPAEKKIFFCICRFGSFIAKIWGGKKFVKIHFSSGGH